MCEHHRPFYALIGGIFEEAIEKGELKTDYDEFFLIVNFQSIDAWYFGAEFLSYQIRQSILNRQ